MTSRQVFCDFEVPFHDVDALRIVWHGNYFKYLELARTALLRACDLDTEFIAQPGYRLLLVDAHCRYTFPLRYGDKARVTACLSAITPRIVISYRIRNLSHNRGSARAKTVLVTTERDGSMLFETPHEVLQRLSSYFS